MSSVVSPKSDVPQDGLSPTSPDDPAVVAEDWNPALEQALRQHLQCEEMNPAHLINPRETMRRLPQSLQPFLTWLTGKPFEGQRPLWRPSAAWVLSTGLIRLLGGAAASALIVSMPAFTWPLLIASWMVTVSGARQLLVHVNHNLVHGNFASSVRLSRTLADAISTLLLVQGFDAYREDHVSVHHSKRLATPEDIDMQFLLALGFGPGQTVGAYWARLRRTILSPRFHLMFLKARLAANFVTPARPRKALAYTFYAGALAALAFTGAWIPILVAWVFPLTMLYQISALLQFACEHRWLRIPDPGASARIILARLTVGRFMGEPLPDTNLPAYKRLLAWAQWWLKMLGVHLPARVFVMTGDLPAHDWHHRHPRSRDWAMPFYARQADVESSTPGWEPYAEVWGLKQALDAVFMGLSVVPPFPECSTSLSANEIVQALTDM